MGGANLAQQYLKAGLLDEVSIHLIPTLLSAGTRLFDNLSPTELDPIEVVASSTTTHLRYRVVR
jgi:dihydrofolate reductase